MAHIPLNDSPKRLVGTDQIANLTDVCIVVAMAERYFRTRAEDIESDYGSIFVHEVHDALERVHNSLDEAHGKSLMFPRVGNS